MNTAFIQLKLFAGLLLLSMSVAGHGQPGGTFTNPLLPVGPDPWVIYQNGYYYYTNTMGNRIVLWKTKTLSQLKEATSKTVWTPPAAGPNSKDIWAPELHFLAGNRGVGRWYLYYTATDVANPGDNSRYVFVLENASADPLSGNWVDKGKINTQHTGLDGSVFEHQGKRYFLYSAYVGPQSNLFIAEMINPWTISEKQVEIARPTYDWEKYDGREICEGPEFLKGKNGKVFIVYSASACWDDDYALGLLSASDNSDPLQASSWKKSPTPVFSKSVENGVFGPGHNGFFLSPDGKENWIVYHGKAVANGKCTERTPRIQPFTWNADGTPQFGKPLPAGTPIRKPSGE